MSDIQPLGALSPWTLWAWELCSFFKPNISPHHGKRGDLNCLEEQPEVQGMNLWEAHMCFQVAHGQRTLADRRQGSTTSGCCQNTAEEVSHHCSHEEDTEKGHVSTAPCDTGAFT